VPYVVGINPNSPQNPHSAPASGGSNISNIDTSPPVEAHVLYGGVVGGPDENDDFWDERKDWVQTEVALDYNAPLVYLAAWKVATDGDDPYYVRLQDGAYASHRPAGTSRPCSDPDDESCAGATIDFPQDRQIAVGVVMAVGALAVIGMWTWYLLEAVRARRARPTKPGTDSPPVQKA